MFDLKKTTYEVFRESVLKFPKQPAIYYMGSLITYQAFLKMINRMAACYKKLNIKQGDTITILAPNTPEGIASYYAASQLGIKASLLHPLSKEERIKEDIKQKDSKLLVTASMFLCDNPGLLNSGFPILAIEVKTSLPAISRLAYPYLYKNDNFAFDKHPEVIRFSKCREEYAGYVHYDNCEGRVYLASGGTSGKEKSIILSDYAFLSLISTGPDILGLSEEKMAGKSMMSALPMFHGFGLTMGIMVMLCYGGSMYLLPKYHTKDVVKALKHNHCHYMIGVPVMYEALLRNPKFSGDILKNLSIAFVGGDFIAPSLLERFNNHMRENNSEGTLYEGYGLTETVTVLSVNTPSAHRDGSVGKPLSVVDVKIIDEENNILPPNQKGEIAVAGETLMNGYLGGEDPFVELEGRKYVKSGDIGYLDEDGFLYFISRKKRMIKRKGFNIYPLPIEKRVTDLSSVVEAAYLSRIENGREETYLFIHLDKESDPKKTEDEIKGIIKAEFFPYEMPDHIIMKDDFPKTKVAKIDYNALLDSLE